MQETKTPLRHQFPMMKVWLTSDYCKLWNCHSPTQPHHELGEKYEEKMARLRLTAIAI